MRSHFTTGLSSQHHPTSLRPAAAAATGPTTARSVPALTASTRTIKNRPDITAAATATSPTGNAVPLPELGTIAPTPQAAAAVPADQPDRGPASLK